MDIASTIPITRWVIAGIVAVLAVAFIVVYRRLSRRRLQRQMAKAELIAMIDEALGEEEKHGPADGTKVWGQRPSWLPTALAVVVVLAVVVWAGAPLLSGPSEGTAESPFASDISTELTGQQDTALALQASVVEKAQQYTLVVLVNPPGSGSVNPDGGTFDSAESVSLTASPSPGHEFDHWSGDASGDHPGVALTMDSDKSVTAYFNVTPGEKPVIKFYTLAMSVYGSGSVSPSGGNYEEGTRVVLTALPDADWEFDRWGGDAGGTSSIITLTMDSSKSVIANFSAVYRSPPGSVNVTTTTTSGMLIARTTAGVDVAVTLATGAPWAPAAGSMITVAGYPANPQSDTPLVALEDGFYDVYFVDTNVGAAAATSVLVKFYNDNITVNTVAYVWSELAGAWMECNTVNALGAPAINQGVNLFGGFAWVTITDVTIPAISDLTGTPFVLVESAKEVAIAPAAPAILTPAFGDEETPVQPTFTWTAVADATSYQFVLAEEIGLDDKFAIIDYSATTDINGHVAREQLKYDTVYNWRVRAVNAVGAGDWTTGFFTTIAD